MAWIGEELNSEYLSECWQVDPFDDRSWVRSLLWIVVALVVLYVGMRQPRPVPEPVQPVPVPCGLVTVVERPILAELTDEQFDAVACRVILGREPDAHQMRSAAGLGRGAMIGMMMNSQEFRERVLPKVSGERR